VTVAAGSVASSIGWPERFGARARPRWELPALLLLLVATACGYLVDLAASGYGNAFYAAAVQAGTQSWKAFFFGSLDSSNFITVDKPPASLWVMELSGRIFGFSSWSMLGAQVLLAVASVALLHATVRRIAGPVPALLAGLVLAVTPVAVLMFRYNNPDALLALLLTVAGYATVRALQTASARWLLLTGTAIGFAFLAKEFQALLAVPGLALAYLSAAPTTLGRRILHLMAAGGAALVAAGWWILAVALWPASSRPYIGGSADNSELGRALGYNGLNRILGGSSGGTNQAALHAAVRRAAPRHSLLDIFSARTGLGRMFGDQVGGQVSWLLPAALVLLAAGLVLTRRAPRTDLTRAALLLFGGWLLVGAAVLSAMQGIFHAYYALILVPPIAGLVTVGGREVWRVRDRRSGRLLLAAVTLLTAVWSCVILLRTPTFATGLAWVVLAAGVAAAAGFLLGGRSRRGTAMVVGAAVVMAAAGSVAYDVATVVTPHAGASVFAGPNGRGLFGPAANRSIPSRFPQAAGASSGRSGGVGTDPSSTRRSASVTDLGVLLHSAESQWSAATAGSSSAAALELASSSSVMAIGGYSGTDPTPTLAQFQAAVRNEAVRYYVATPGRGHGLAGPITAWVAQHYTARTIGGRIVYDLQPAESE
jgi:4-amino-4-deoxy-L-arabinose transferase-like glycosyltransferase